MGEDYGQLSLLIAIAEVAFRAWWHWGGVKSFGFDWVRVMLIIRRVLSLMSGREKLVCVWYRAAMNSVARGVVTGGGGGVT